jgi:hypothetical protein
MDPIKKRIYISTIALLGAVIFAVLFIISRPSIHPPVIPPEATSTEPIKYISDNSSYTVIGETYTVPWSETCNEVSPGRKIDPIISVTYPQIQGLSKTELELNINIALENDFLVDSIKDVTAMCNPSENLTTYEHVGLVVAFAVKLQTDEFLSMKYAVTKNLLSNLRPNVEYNGYTIDLSDGSVVSYKDLFKADSASRREMKSLVIAGLPSQIKSNPDMDRDILDYDFYLTKDSIVFYNIFLSPALRGTEVKIPFEKVKNLMVTTIE